VAENPFLALRPFRREDAAVFFGRDADLILVKSRLVSARTTLLFAASGVGKSSFLNAKLAPAVESQWHIVTHRSWATCPPLQGVRQSMGAKAPSLGLEPLPVCDQAARLIAERGAGRGCLLMLDQFEEVFQHWRDSKALDEFAAEIARMAHLPGMETRVLISMREEFLGELSIFDNLIPDLFNNSYRLKNATRAEAEDIIIRTALTRKVETGSGVEPLVEDLVSAASRMAPATQSEQSSRGLLPMPFLQIICYRLWQRQMIGGSGRVRTDVRFLDHAPGPVRAELERYCREKVEALSEAEQDLASAAFGLLMTRSGAKMAYPLDVLAEQAGVEEGPLLAVLEKLATEDVRILRDIPAGPGTKPWFELYHDLYSRFLSDWKRERDAAQEKRRGWRRLEVVALVVLASTMIVAGFMAYRAAQERSQTEESANRLLAEQLLQVAKNERTADGHVTSGSVRFALESWLRDPNEASRAFLREALQATAIETGRRNVTDVDQLAISPDGQILCEVVADGIRLSRLPSGTEIGFAPRTVWVSALAFSPDGATVAAAGFDGRVEFLSTANASSVMSIDVITGGQVTALTYSPDGELVAVAAEDGSAHVAAVYSTSAVSVPRLTIAHRRPVSVVAFSPDGRSLLTGSDDGAVRLRDLQSGREIMFEHPARVVAAAFRPGGEMFATSSADGTTRGTLVSEDVAVEFSGPSSAPANALVFSPQGRFLATGQGVLWDVSARTQPGQPLGTTGSIDVLAFTPDDRILAVGGSVGAFLIATSPARILSRLSAGEPVGKMFLGPPGDSMAIQVRDTLRFFRLVGAAAVPESDDALEAMACSITGPDDSARITAFLGKQSPLGCRPQASAP
jgi:WD domain, G-beta repeat